MKISNEIEDKLEWLTSLSDPENSLSDLPEYDLEEIRMRCDEASKEIDREMLKRLKGKKK